MYHAMFIVIRIGLRYYCIEKEYYDYYLDIDIMS